MASPRMLLAFFGVAVLAAPVQGYRSDGARLVRAVAAALVPAPGLEALEVAARDLRRAVALTTTDAEDREVRRLGHQLALALERVFLDRARAAPVRDRAAETLAPLRWTLSGGVPGPDLGALDWLLDQWLPRYLGRDRGRMLALGGDVAQRRRAYDKALRRYRQAASLGALTPAQRRQLTVLETMREHRHAGTLVEAAPDARFQVEVGARVSYSQAEAIRSHFERAYTDWASRFGFTPRHGVLVRVLVDDDLERILSRHVQGLTESAGILLRIRPGETAADLAAVSRHEYVHFALERMVGPGRLPRWLHEGVATWFEDAALPVALYRRLLDARQTGLFPDAAALESFRSRDPGAIRRLYDAAALLVSRRVHAGGDGALQRILEAVGDGARLPQVWRRETGRSLQESLDELQGELLELVRDRIRLARGEPPPPRAVPEEPGLVLTGEGGTLTLTGDDHEGPGLELLPAPPPPRPRPRRDRQGRLRGHP